jgi:prophage regulatory protein
MSESIRILRRGQVQSLTGLCRSAIYQLISSGQFPRSIPLGPRSVGWIESEISEWIRSRVAARTDPATRAHSTTATRANQQAAA